MVKRRRPPGRVGQRVRRPRRHRHPRPRLLSRSLAGRADHSVCVMPAPQSGNRLGKVHNMMEHAGECATGPPPDSRSDLVRGGSRQKASGRRATAWSATGGTHMPGKTQHAPNQRDAEGVGRGTGPAGPRSTR
jgi:hypothetical protein